jgi:FlaA1/EpsC-like NDP-sugar epimerase
MRYLLSRSDPPGHSVQRESLDREALWLRHGRVVIITGGGGIGRRYCAAFAQAGYRAVGFITGQDIWVDGGRIFG